VKIRTSNKWHDEITFMRCIAIIFIVLGHSFSKVQTITSSTPCTFTGYAIWSFAIALFFTISGYTQALQEDTNKRLSRKYVFYIKKKALRLLVPFTFVYFVIDIPMKLYTGYWHMVTENLFWHVLKDYFFLHKEVRHLWFILALFVVFAAFPIIKYLDTKIKWYCVFPLLIISHLCVHRFRISTFQLEQAVFYMIFFYFGYKIYWNRDKTATLLKNNYIFFILTVGSAASIFLYSYFKTYSPEISFYGFPINKVIRAGYFTPILPVLIFFRLGWDYRSRGARKAVIESISCHSYSIYLLHHSLILVIYAALYQNNLFRFYLIAPVFLISLIVPFLFSKYVIPKSNVLKRCFGTI